MTDSEKGSAETLRLLGVARLSKAAGTSSCPLMISLLFMVPLVDLCGLEGLRGSGGDGVLCDYSS